MNTLHRLIITPVTTISLLACALVSQAVGSAPNHAHPSEGSSHRVFRHAVSKTGPGAPRAQNVKAPGAPVSVAGQAAAGGNSNPLLNKKKANAVE